MNAYAERFVRSIKDESLGRMILVGQGSLGRAIDEFIAHYHLERNHQGLANRLVQEPVGQGKSNGQIVRRERLGGMLSFYHRVAA